MAEILGAAGYEYVLPEGTFYMLVRSPLADGEAFAEILLDQKICVIPGHTFYLPSDWFRLSLTSSMDMCERSEAGFVEAMRIATEQSTIAQSNL